MTNLARPAYHFVATVIDSCGFETECSANSLARIAMEIDMVVDANGTSTYKIWNAKTDQLAGFVTVYADKPATYRAA